MQLAQLLAQAQQGLSSRAGSIDNPWLRGAAQTGAAVGSIPLEAGQLVGGYFQNYLDKFRRPGLENQRTGLINAGLLSELFNSPQGRAALLTSPDVARMAGLPTTGVERGTVTREGYPMFSERDRPLFPYVTQIPRGLPPGVETPETAQMRQRLADAQQQELINRYLERVSKGGHVGNLIPTQFKAGPLTLGLPPPPYDVPEQEQPAITQPPPRTAET